MLPFKIIINSTYEQIDMAVTRASQYISTESITTAQPFNFLLICALRELLTNAVEHGNGLVAEKKVLCRISVSKSQLRIDVCDEGSGFSLQEKLYENQSLDTLRERGRGLLIVTKLGFVLNVRRGHVTAMLKLNNAGKVT